MQVDISQSYKCGNQMNLISYDRYLIFKKQDKKSKNRVMPENVVLLREKVDGIVK
ncbi:hypothetical protein [Methanolobus sp. WCC4]|uniref:hypothetical protein n=1 Tax=Methanolobus sp. WCC4 TaxID=3125784 RepID=UPI0030F4DE73